MRRTSILMARAHPQPPFAGHTHKLREVVARENGTRQLDRLAEIELAHPRPQKFSGPTSSP
jgi:hypothetical protein